jgi:hypothetical protein
MATQTDHHQVQQLITKLNRLCGIDPAGIERISRAVDLELENLKATAKSLSRAELEICAGTGCDPEMLAQFQAQQRADEKIVASIPHDSLIILKVLVGDNNAKIAARWTETQRQIADGRIPR